LFVSATLLQEQRLQPRETVTGSSPDENVAFRDDDDDDNNNNNSYDIERYVSNDQAYGKLSSNKD
jgi:hypothetical protein